MRGTAGRADCLVDEGVAGLIVGIERVAVVGAAREVVGVCEASQANVRARSVAVRNRAEAVVWIMA